MTSFSVTLLSGGLDSTTVTAYAKEKSDELSAITFHYGQSHSKEVSCAMNIATILDVNHHMLDISFLKDVAWYSALTNPEIFPVPEKQTLKQTGTSIPITYVPMRNTIFLALSTAYLESSILNAIEVEGISPETIEAKVYMAPNVVDYSGYPDCRPAFYKQMAKCLNLGSKLGTEYGISVQVETPIIHMSKAEIITMGSRLMAPLEYTWSCYNGGETPCATCESCILRAKGFKDVGIPDPLLVRLGIT